MNDYDVIFSWTMSKKVTISATDADDLLVQAAALGETIDPVTEGTYVADSFTIDTVVDD